jgi:hypothetical protein
MLKQLFSCSFKSTEETITQRDKWISISKEIDHNRNKIDNIENRMQVDNNRLEDHINIKVEIINSKIDNVIMLLNNKK